MRKKIIKKIKLHSIYLQFYDLTLEFFILGNFVPPKEIQAVKDEYQKLRTEKRLDMFLYCFDNHLSNNFLKIIIHNIQSITKSIEYIRTDDGFFQRADIIMLHEAWLNSSDDIELTSFDIISRQNIIKNSSSKAFGSVIYIKKNSELPFQVFNSTRIEKSKSYFQLTCIKTGRLFISSLYKSPEFSKDELMVKH